MKGGESVVNDMGNSLTDIQFKDELRRQLITYREYLELIEENNIEKLKQKFNAEIERINASLQD